MKLLIYIVVAFSLSACASEPKTNNEFLSSLPSSVRTDVCTNKKYLSCAGVTDMVGAAQLQR